MNTKVVRNPIVAKRLLEKGYTIVDLRPKKEKPTESLFIFEIKEDFEKDLDLLLKK